MKQAFIIYGFVLSMVRFSPSIEQGKQGYNYKANDVGVVYNKWTNHLLVYRHLLTNMPELCLANS